ncbi:capping protein-inhibiting regulator of actin dynamics isoform X1 [Balaenoptera ricei]|uniref:capping protein-inhibiting regulator of actin dynamics isoform X1 n=2 Tax=Balaenoptera ricei TaxID=2746895 RepID=UPI0028BDC353|nr:capping protein-inhibiting regulator of actin dynamics isoform X1 [Balaenoptera ricei]XP_059778923.1 capping protein-inhibiting regulator of actin dynamics isoform X1 [Balaenoptera ricei]
MSQDNILGKVKTLQRQLGTNIKFGQPPPNAIPMKKADSGEAHLEEDPFLTSPMEIVAQQDVILSDTENKSSETPSSLSPLNPPGAGSEMEEKAAPVKPSRPKRHFSSASTIESVNLDAIPLAIARLDNSAAKHKLSIKPKKQRVSRRHRRLVGDRQNEQGGFRHQLSLDQNGHPGEDKPIWHEEEPEALDSEEEKRRQEEYWQELEAKCKRQKAEAAERQRLEEQRLQVLERRLWEEKRRQEELLEEEGEEEEGEVQLEAAKRQREEAAQSPEEPGCRDPERREQDEGGPPEAEEPRRLEEEAWRLEEEARRLERRAQQEELEARGRQEAEELRREEEERALEELRRLEEQRRRAAEKQRLEEERRREELRRQELEAQRQREEEEKRMQELRKQEELEAQRLREDAEAKSRQEAEKKLQEAPRVEEENQPLLDHKRGLRSPFQSDIAEKAEQEHLKLEKPRENSEEPSIWVKQSQEATGPPGEQPGKQGDVPGDHRCGWQEEREETNAEPPQKQEAQVEEALAPGEKKEAAAPETDRKVEELRWQEVDERQTMPRPYTFQVSSGGKQILFPKVNLSPVKPMKDEGLASGPQEPKVPKASPASHALPSSLSIPHTAILVTGAQLCGPAVNLSQIKDTACKSLLGLSEEKKHVDVPALENPPRAPGDPRAGSGKTRPSQESPSSMAALAEWASIRSRILKNAESDQRGERDESRPGDEHTPRGRCDSRGNLRRTPPVNAKFSIKPAWQKFSDGGWETSKQNTEAESIRKRSLPGPSEEARPQLAAADTKEPVKGAEKPGAHQEPTDTTEGCKFAKDLPSFLVPSLPYPPQKAVAQAEPVVTSDSETTGGVGKPEPVMPGGEDKASPFGIKLRRTNYSLRFHCDQQTEQKKKKKHGSMGDSISGAPSAPGSTAGERETEAAALKHGPSLPPERKQAPAPWKDSAESPPSQSPLAAQPGPPAASSQPPAPERDRAANRTPLAQKPALAPKPAGQTPPSSPISKLSRPYLVELLARRAGKPDPEPGEPCKEGRDNGDPRIPSAPPTEERKDQKRDEEEEVETERKPASPALSAARQEKPSATPEAGRKEKPTLQSRHSLDGSKLAEKVETAQPLWITLALQKQKGFREQQATREERKQAREAKQAEKLSKENVSVSPQPGSSSVSRAGSLHKSTAQPEEKKPETAASRLERREQLKKANTLPTSVTVEISDSAPPAPLVKEVTKRFSTPDAAPVSTEPAWLALAKRKAKAWSDCPQIIK